MSNFSSQLGAVIVLVIMMMVGVYAFWELAEQGMDGITHTATSDNLENQTYFGIFNSTERGNSIFNIIGVVLVIAAIMSIVGLISTWRK